MSRSPSPPDRMLAAAVFREEARAQGFVRCGFARAGEPPRFGRFLEWIAAGQHAGMRYLERTAGLRSRPQELMPGACTIVCLAARHETRPLVAADGSRIARYAAGADYHWTLSERARRVAESAARRLDGPFAFRVCVDSTPLAERSFAAAAGLGWIGKNGCLIDPEHGSFLLLAEIVTDLDLPLDDPAAELCGSCVRCLAACPTEAFVEPKVLDARRCLAYWTIEHRGPMPDQIKVKLAEHVFGCDICQEVCPWNQPLLSSEAPQFSEALAKEQAQSSEALAKEEAPGDADNIPTRAQWLAMGRGVWRRRWGATAINRAGRRGVQRNAAASAGSTGERDCAPLLEGAQRAGDAGLADASSWALSRLEEREG